MAKKRHSSLFGSIITLSLLCTIIFFYLMVLLHSQNITKYFKEKINFTVELKANSSKADQQKILDLLESQLGIQHNSIDYIPKQEAMQLMDDIVDPAMYSNDQNPFNDIFLFNVEADFFNNEFLEKLERKFTTKSQVKAFYNQKLNFSEIRNNLFVLQIVLFGLALIFILMGIVILQNTIKSVISQDKILIKNMEFVGAKRSFIKRPFLRRTQWVLYRSYVIAAIMISLTFILIYYSFPALFNLLRVEWILASLALGILITLVVTRLSTHRQMNVYLSKNLYDLYY